ncbi:MAG: DNA polymerase IV [Treponema sp.]|nr:DNA polymerase IV [Treponema sp.]
MQEIQNWFLHVDLDAFFASVEQLDHPEYRGKPLIVGGKPDDRRSVVSTASYEARKYGVHSAMPTFQAYKLCPQGIYVHCNMKRYSEMSYKIMSIFKDFSPDVEQMSIDEAFIDIKRKKKLFGPPEETALKIKKTVKDYTGLTVSIGLAPTKYLAKIASDMNKPDGFYMIKPGSEQDFMLSLPLKKVFGIGTKSLENLNKHGIFTTRDIYEKSLDMLQFLCGKNMGTFLYKVVRGEETETFSRKQKSHSISAETTFPYDVYESYACETTLLQLCHTVYFRLLRENSFSKTVMVKIRYEDFSTVSIQETDTKNIMTLDSFFEIAKRLFNTKRDEKRGIRLLGVGLENITKEEGPQQQELFDDGSEKKQAVEKAILNLEKKHPEIKIQKARLFKK